MTDALPRDKKGIRIDVRGERDLVFSAWHRKNLKRECYVTDVDFLEYRFNHKGEIVLKAIFEVKEWHVTQPKYIEDNANFKAIKKLCELVGILFFVVWYKTDETNNILEFRIWNVFKEEKADSELKTPDELKEFIESL